MAISVRKIWKMSQKQLWKTGLYNSWILQFSIHGCFADYCIFVSLVSCWLNLFHKEVEIFSSSFKVYVNLAMKESNFTFSINIWNLFKIQVSYVFQSRTLKALPILNLCDNKDLILTTLRLLPFPLGLGNQLKNESRTTLRNSSPFPFRWRSSSARPPFCPTSRRQTPSPRRRCSPRPGTKVNPNSWSV